MPKIPYFKLGRHSFEKNSGYKSTVHALAELIDNSVEADAKRVAIVLMVNQESRLVKIAVIDDGSGMAAETLQNAVCEKSGSYLDRQLSGGGIGRRKFGKYGVGLPKASISQCNRFRIWSWVRGGSKCAHVNGINILDEEWINAGAEVAESKPEPAPTGWLKLAGLNDSESGSLILWEALDGLTWARARWGKHSGLIPNLEFQIGRVYRKMIGGDDPELELSIHVVDEAFGRVEPATVITPNDPLYLTEGCKIPRLQVGGGEVWPAEDPLFDDLTGSKNSMDIEIPIDGKAIQLKVTWCRSAAFRNTFARRGKTPAGSLPHGKHAAHNVGLSLLREGREVELSQALTAPSEPRERWFGVEFDFPHELDGILGMTNNKQSYTRLDQVLKQSLDDYKEDEESTQQCLDRIDREDPRLALCLKIAWKIREIWYETRKCHMRMREEHVALGEGGDGEGGEEGEAEPEKSPVEKAEEFASEADGDQESDLTEEEKVELRDRVLAELKEAGVPSEEAEQIAARIVDRGMSYAIISRKGLGSPFFNVGGVVDAKLIELNEDHGVYPYLLSTVEAGGEEDPEKIIERLDDAKTAVFLMLEAWAKVESEAARSEKRILQRMREDWGRSLDAFVERMNEEEV